MLPQRALWGPRVMENELLGVRAPHSGTPYPVPFQLISARDHSVSGRMAGRSRWPRSL